MKASINLQTLMFLQAVIFGVLIGIVYDFFKSIRVEFKLKTLGVLLCDSIFIAVLLASFLIFALNIYEIRFYVIVGVVLGTILYSLTVTELFYGMFKIVFRLIYNILYRIMNTAKKIIKYFKVKFLENEKKDF